MNESFSPDPPENTRVLQVGTQLQIPRSEFRFTFSRSSGPGGQNVNKVNTKARLHWPIAESASLSDDVREQLLARCKRRINTEGELVVASQRYRDQQRNVEDCLEKLQGILTEALAPRKPRRPTRRTAGSNRRRLETKKQRSQLKQSRKPPRDAY